MQGDSEGSKTHQIITVLRVYSILSTSSHIHILNVTTTIELCKPAWKLHCTTKSDSESIELALLKILSRESKNIHINKKRPDPAGAAGQRTNHDNPYDRIKSPWVSILTQGFSRHPGFLIRISPFVLYTRGLLFHLLIIYIFLSRCERVFLFMYCTEYYV